MATKAKKSFEDTYTVKIGDEKQLRQAAAAGAWTWWVKRRRSMFEDTYTVGIKIGDEKHRVSLRHFRDAHRMTLGQMKNGRTPLRVWLQVYSGFGYKWATRLLPWSEHIEKQCRPRRRLVELKNA